MYFQTQSMIWLNLLLISSTCTRGGSASEAGGLTGHGTAAKCNA